MCGLSFPAASILPIDHHSVDEEEERKVDAHGGGVGGWMQCELNAHAHAPRPSPNE